MDFDYAYFKDEIREGFYIRGMIKRSWACQIEIFKVVTDICRKHDIKWFADSGTLLGTVRHAGFVPWDDDLDIGMLRDEYIRFNEIVQSELPEGYRVFNVDVENEYNNFLTRIVNNTVINTDTAYLKNHHGYPYISGIDVIPYDYMFEDEEEEDERWKEAKALWDKCAAIGDPARMPLKELDDIFSRCHERTKFVTLMPIYLKDKNRRYPVSCYEKTIKLPFENILIDVPAGYEELLPRMYGDWYKVHKDGGCHDYPYFGQQEELLLEAKRPVLYQYAYDGKADVLINQRNDHALKKKNNKVIFMPVGASDWKAMQAMYESFALDSELDVLIMPVPFSERDDIGNPVEWKIEIPDAGPNARFLNYDKYDFENEHAYMFVIQNPFNEYESGFTVYPFFYSTNLKRYADCLVYCHSYEIDDIDPEDERSHMAIRQTVISPGVMHADMVCVPNENIKAAYMKILSENPTPYTMDEWNERIFVLPQEEGMDGDLSGAAVGQQIDKKKLIFYVSVSDIYCYGEDAINWIKKAVDTFKSEEDTMDIVWIKENEFEDNLKSVRGDMYDAFINLQKSFRDNGWQIVSFENVKELLKDADAFYGSPGYIMNLCVREHLPVMVRDINIQ